MRVSRYYVLYVGLSFVAIVGTVSLPLYRLLSAADCVPEPGKGPDVIVGDVGPGIERWGSKDGITAFSFRTVSCNLGDEVLLWKRAPSPDHPVIGQNLYRLRNVAVGGGVTVQRLEQIGMSWLKHGFLALRTTTCCDNCIDPGTNQRLGINCSDPYSAFLNGGDEFNELGPRSVVNAATGIFPGTFDPPDDPSVIDRRLQVHTVNINPDLPINAGATYFIEGQYVTRDDAEAGNSNNNASYRLVVPVAINSGIDLQIAPGATTQREQPAIAAWKAADNAVVLKSVDVPDDGRFHVAIRSTEVPGGTFHHEVAVHNLNSHRSAQSLTIQTASGSISNAGFHAVESHSGEPFSNDPWTATVSGAEVTWATQSHSENANANAIRWGTTYSFWFDSTSAAASIEIGLFRPGMPTAVSVPLDTDDEGVERRRVLSRRLPTRAAWVKAPEAISLSSNSSFQVVCQAGLSVPVDFEVDSSLVQLTHRKFTSGNTVGWDVNIQPSPNAPRGFFETGLTIKSEGRKSIEVRLSGNKR